MYYEINPGWWRIVRGERFRCTQCGACCDRPGYVFFDRDEAKSVAQYLGITPRRFLRKFARPEGSPNRYELKMRPGGDCPFYRKEDRTCGIHPVKFAQCRTYPFWPEHVESGEAWEKARRECEGIGQGPKVRKREVGDCLRKSARV